MRVHISRLYLESLAKSAGVDLALADLQPSGVNAVLVDVRVLDIIKQALDGNVQEICLCDVDEDLSVADDVLPALLREQAC